MKIPDETISWLMDSNIPYIRYNAKLFFSPDKADKKELLKDEFIVENLSLLNNWNNEVVKRHNKADLLLHRLALLADLGITAEDKGMKPVISTIMKSVNENGVPEIIIEIPTNFGGSGKPEQSWIICDFPTILYSLLKMGVNNEQIKKGVRALEQIVDDDGYHCIGSIPKFRGPGPKTSICPYANLLAAKALAEDEGSLKRNAAKKAVEALLRHWDERKEKKYFLFGIGTDFKKLKFPFVWYNILHVLYAVSNYSKYHSDKRVIEMAEELMAKADLLLRFKPESVFISYKGRDFANKKEYSQTLTFFALKVLIRLKIVNV